MEEHCLPTHGLVLKPPHFFGNNKDIPQQLCQLLLKSEVKNSTYDGDVMAALRDYIWQKKLFDPKHNHIVCKGDALREIVGVDTISILEIKKLLAGFHPTKNSNEVLENYATLSSPFPPREKSSISKRKAEENESEAKRTEKRQCVCGHDLCCAHYKRAASPMFLHIPLCSTHESSDDSSYSIQNYETSVVTDSSDDDISFVEDSSDNSHFLPSGSILTISETYELEFEPESDSISLYSSDSDSSEWDSIMHMDSVITFVCKDDEDQEFWADKSSDDDEEFWRDKSSDGEDFDAEISEFDLWHCRICNSINNPVNRFCLKCFETREGWLPPEKGMTEKIPHHAFSKRKPRTKRKKRERKGKDSSIKDASKPSTSQENGPHEDFNFFGAVFSKKSDHKKDLESKKLCLICCDKPIDACVIHGKIAHSYFCFGCSKRFKRCPICRRSIEKVVFLIS